MRSTSAGSRPRARKALPSDVEGCLVCIRHDPLLSPLDLIAHELVEHQVRLLRIFEGDAPKCPGPWVERGVPELLRVHLAETLVPRDRGLSAALSIVAALIRVRGGNVSLLLGLLSGATTGPGRRLIPVGGGLLASGLLAVLALALRGCLQVLDRLVALVVRVCPPDFLAELQPIKGWLADVDPAVLHEWPEVSIQESEEERADVRAVDVCVAQEDRLAVPELLDVEVVPYPCAERGDERLDFLVPEHLVGARLLDVQDLAPQRQDRLCPPVTAALRAAAGGRALHDEEFALLGVALRAISELARQRKSVEGALALDEIACLARRLSGAKSGEALLDDAPRVGGVLLEVLAEGVVHRRGDLTGDLGVAEPRLGLPLELGLADLHADDCRESLPHVVGGQIRVGLFQGAALARVCVDGAGESSAEPGEVCAAVNRVDVVRERIDLFCERVVVLERDLSDRVVVESALDIDRLRMEVFVRPI